MTGEGISAETGPEPDFGLSVVVPFYNEEGRA